MVRLKEAIGLLAAVLVGALATLWATDTILESDGPSDADELPAPITVFVSEDAVGRSTRFAGMVEWEPDLAVRTPVSGVLTTLGGVGSPLVVDVGDSPASIDLQPLVFAQGEVPVFRQMRLGDEGQDVLQLQAFLARSGFFGAEPDGDFGSRTRLAVRNWEQELGVEVDGVVDLGQVVFVPELPARVASVTGLETGKTVTSGEPLFGILASEPAFSISVPIDQSADLSSGLAATITAGDETWQARLGASTVEVESGSVRWSLTTPDSDGRAPCGEDCASVITPGAATRVTVNVEVVPPVEGASVPTAAILSDAELGTHVLTADGERVPIVVEATDLGIAIISGIEPGVQVVIESG